jgi:microcystin-dependent protein
MTTYVGQIICVGFNFAPEGWALCDGSLIRIADNPTLFQLIGTTYGGDGQTTFGLPDLRGRTPVGTGQLSGGGNYVLGQGGGAEQVTIALQNYPAHTHPLTATSNSGNANALAGGFLAGGQQIYNSNNPLTADALNSTAVSMATGGNQPHKNLQPFMTCSWIISLYGIYPSQT